MSEHRHDTNTDGVATAGHPHEHSGTAYTCPMHPEIRENQPGSCPKCGMALEPVMPSLDDDESPELARFRARFWWTLPLTVTLFLLAMFSDRLRWFTPFHSGLDRARVVRPGSPVGWSTHIRSIRAVVEDPQRQHVDTHRSGYGGGVHL